MKRLSLCNYFHFHALIKLGFPTGNTQILWKTELFYREIEFFQKRSVFLLKLSLFQKKPAFLQDLKPGSSYLENLAKIRVRKLGNTEFLRKTCSSEKPNCSEIPSFSEKPGFSEISYMIGENCLNFFITTCYRYQGSSENVTMDLTWSNKIYFNTIYLVPVWRDQTSAISVQKRWWS